MSSMSPSLRAEDLQVLCRLIREHSYREGDFLLASGQRSPFYIDLKATTLHPEGAHWIGKLIVAAMGEEASKIQGVGGLTLGADPIATAASLAARDAGKFWPAFIVRKEPKSHGTSRYIEGVENLVPSANLLIVEDVVTTGGSSVKAIERIREAGYQCAGVITVVDREQGGAEAFARAGVPFYRLATITQVREA